MLMAGSTTRLFVNMVLAVLLIGFWCWIAADGDSPWLSLGFVLLCLMHTTAVAVQLIDLKTPVLSAGPNGLVLSNKLTSHDLIHWDEVKNFSVIELHYPVSLPLFSYLLIRTGSPRHFSGLSRLLPTAWLGIYLIPTRLLHGGAKAARQMIGTIRNLREADRHGQVGGGREFMSESSIAWAMLRNVTFPVGKDGPGEEAMVGAVRDSLLEEAGVHRDLLPEPYRERILASDSGKALAAKGEAWGRQLAREMAAESKPAAAPAPRVTPKEAKPADFGRRGAMLNGKPLK